MSQKNKIHTMWPTYFGEFYNPDHEEIKIDLVDYFKKYMNDKPSKKNNGENYNLYESDYNLHLEGNPTFNKLIKEFIAKGFVAMAKQANKGLLNTENKDLTVTITASWFIHYAKNGFVLPHSHISNSSWCCVYYLQLGKDATRINGGTYFQKPLPNRHTVDYGSLYNKYTMTQFAPEEGKMLIWPSYLSHGSFPYAGDNDKIIISANAEIPLLENNKPIASL